MTTFEAVILGLIQGLTEFLPISSTAHLRVVPALVGWNDPGAAFTAVTQLGTLVATLVYFRKDLWRLFVGAIAGLRSGKPLETPESRLALGIIAGTFPIGLCGIAFKSFIKHELRSLWVIAFTLVALAIVLWLAERFAKHQKDIAQMTFRDAFLVGVAQALALVPGVSRSGVTLTAGLLLGLRRESAARFSFLLSVPAVAAAGLFELKDVLESDAIGRGVLVPTAIATAVAFVSGLGAIAFLIAYLQKKSTAIFIGYRIALGILLAVLLVAGVLAPTTGLVAPAP